VQGENFFIKSSLMIITTKEGLQQKRRHMLMPSAQEPVVKNNALV